MRLSKVFHATLFTLTGVCSFLPSGTAQAHELLPKALVEYVQEHPDATAEELKAFIQANPDLQSADTERQEKLVTLARQGPQNFFVNCWEFFKLGVEHILIGLDHVLFVLVILLTFVSLRRTIWLLSCFTLSHGITLILAGSNILRVSGSIVEPLIALSIAYMAITSVFLAKKYPFFAATKTKSLTILCFGFFHGMGFAGALEEIALPTDVFTFLASLLSFNLGVDAGQIIIAVVALPVLYFARRKGWYRQATCLAAAVISALAIFWFIERIVHPA
jgi:hydrogenase/urease accessory protein HupE